jgi:hypothetical protein
MRPKAPPVRFLARYYMPSVAMLQYEQQSAEASRTGTRRIAFSFRCSGLFHAAVPALCGQIAVFVAEFAQAERSSHQRNSGNVP